MNLQSFFGKLVTLLVILMMFVWPFGQIAAEETSTETNPVSIDMLEEALVEHSQEELAGILQETYQLDDENFTAIRDAEGEEALLDAINNSIQEVGGGNKVEVQALSASGSANPIVNALVNSTDDSQRLRVEANKHTGAASYSYPFFTPQGIAGLNPGLKISYSSENKFNDSIVGYGWNLNLPYIQRRNINGLDNLYSSNNFQSSLHGNLKEVSPGQYQAQFDDGQMAIYTQQNGGWVMTTKEGYSVFFGTTSASRKDNTASSTEVYAWMADKVTDRNGNQIDYTYFKNTGQIYPDAITYGPYSVEFSREVRGDDLVSYAPGFYTKTNYRINEILVKHGGVNIRKYDLGYTVGDNDNRSMLESIQETGYTGMTVTTQDPTVFTYSEHSRQWIGTTNNYSIGGGGNPNLFNYTDSFPVDLNGDGWIDWAHVSDEANGFRSVSDKRAIHNTNTSLVTDPNPTNPLPAPVYISGGYWLYCSSTSQKVASVFTDLNGDRQFDQIEAQNYDTANCGGNGNYYTDNYSGYLGQAGGAWATNTSYASDLTLSVPYSNLFNFVRDLNADGLPDVLYNDPGTSSVPQGATAFPAEVHMNTGSGFGLLDSVTWKMPLQADSWGIPYKNKTHGGNSAIADYNGDGVTDILSASSTSVNITEPLFFGNGRGDWIADSQSWGGFKVGGGSQLYNPNFIWQIDVNSDGLIDFVNFIPSSTYGADGIFVNTGEEFIKTHPDYTLANLAAIHPNNSDHPYVDINADGLIDKLERYGNSGGVTATLAQGMVPDHLIRVDHSTGASTSIEYKPSTHYKDTSGALLNPNLGTIVQTVSAVSTDDGNGVISVTNYEYAQGHYFYNNAEDRRFAGFGKVVTTNSKGEVTEAYFHQGNGDQGDEVGDSTDGSKIGKVWKTVTKDAGGTTRATIYSNWDSFDLGNDRDFVYMSGSVSDLDGKQTAETRVYDTSSGNLTSMKSLGTVSITNTATGAYNNTGQDDRNYSYTYTAGAIQLPVKTIVTNGSQTVSETRNFYDGLSLGSVTTGNLTKNRKKIGSSSWAKTTYTHDTYGNVLTETDPENNTTTYVYDSYDLYVATATNAVGHVSGYVYDYATGQPTSVTDANGNVVSRTYDGLGRPLSVTSPLGLTQSFVYNDTATPRWSRQTNHLSGSNAVDSFTYLDGLDRPIQTKTETENTNQWITVDTTYDEQGRVFKQSLPYFTSSSGYSLPITTATLIITTNYDVLGRVTSISDVTGNTNTSYVTWSSTVTDKLGNQKTLTTDAFGNLIQVIEEGNLVTNYEYDTNNNLIKIIDASANVRNFTYDLLGRRLTAEDLHDASDTTFGVYTYVYDKNGNIIQLTDPKNQLVVYTYDNLNRLLTETHGIDVTAYSYDSGVNGKGQLSSVTSSSGSTAYVYDQVGNVLSETVTINTVSYPTSYQYDRQGNQTQITYPDSKVTTYTYNNGGQQETVSYDNQAVLLDIDYGPNGKVIYQNFYNNVDTNYTYDASELYRLRNITTETTTSTRVFQDIDYTYDAVGNIINLIESSDTDTAKTATYSYDDLYRLAQASVTNVAAGSGYTENYTYGPTGNILTGPTGTYNYATPGKTNPQAVTSIGTTNYIYDDNGNLTQKGIDTYSWNYQNRLIQSSVTTTPAPNGQTEDSLVADGYIQTANASWTTAHSASSGTAKTHDSTIQVGTGKDINGDYEISRGYLPFDVSFLPNNATVTNASIILTPTAVSNDDADGDDWITLVAATPDNPTTIMNDDFDEFSTTELIDTTNRLSLGNVTLNQPYTFTLSPTGINSINPTTFTTIGLREGHDFLSSTYTGTTNTTNQLTFATREHTNPNYHPKLTLTYTTPGSITPTTITTTYTYNHSGQRLTKDNSTTTTTYPNQLYNITGTKVTKHIESNGLTIATIQDNDVYTHHTDHLGGASMMINATTQDIQATDYTSFGSIRVDTKSGSFAEQKKFTGHEYDSESNLHYANARYYHQDVGRFVSQDPWEGDYSNPQTLNKYSYALNNPINVIDPDGREPTKSEASTVTSLQTHLAPDAGLVTKDAYKQSVSSLANQYKEGFSTTNFPRYVYTEQKGWIDLKHFFAAAESTYDRGGLLTRIFGFGLEIKQKNEKRPSGFSYEDLPSNDAGIEFARMLRKHAKDNPDGDIANYVSGYLQRIGATTPENAPNYDKLPEYEEAFRTVGNNNSTSKKENFKENE